jgi:hypothetical protein
VALEQDSGELGAVEQQVIGPFEKQRQVGRGGLDRFDQGEAGGERKRLRRRVARRQLDDRAAEEIAAPADPLARLAAAAGLLDLRDQPVAFAGLRASKQVGVGRAGALDDPDSAQNRLPAARSATAPSGPISR